jgi:deaminated glutathione amidase
MNTGGTSFRAACIQMRSGTDQNRNIADMSELVREAAAAGAIYVQTPEMTGVVQRSRKELFAVISPDAENPVFAAAAGLAAKLGIWLHIGSSAVDLGGGRAANRAALFAPSGRRVATYDKIHMFDVDLDNGESWRESAVYQPGAMAVIVEGMPANTGLAICYDLRFAELFRRQALKGAYILTCPSCFTRATGEAHWHVLLRARAIENGAYLIAAAQGGLHEDGRQSFGHSMIVDPWGRIVAELDHDEPGVLIGEIVPDEVVEARRKIPNLKNLAQYELRIVTAGENEKSHSAAEQV